MAKKHSNSYKSHESTQNAPEQHSGKVKNVVADTKNDVRLTIQDDETSHEKQPSAPLASQQEDTAKLIAAHKAALVAEEEQAVAPHSASTAEVKSVKKKGKIDRNPLNWVRHIGTRALSGIV